MLEKLIMFLCRLQYNKQRKFNKRIKIFYIRGTGKDYGRYLLYTEDEQVYERMDEF